MEKSLEVIGGNALVTIAGHENIPAKIDTGADSSAIWASDISVSKDGELTFVLFAPGSPFYTGEIHRCAPSEYAAAMVRSATGEEQVRYRAHLQIKLHGRKIRALFNLSDRSRNRFPVLIGRRTIRNKFIVDVARSEIPQHKRARSSSLTTELRESPQKFHQKYFK